MPAPRGLAAAEGRYPGGRAKDGKGAARNSMPPDRRDHTPAKVMARSPQQITHYGDGQ